MRRALKWFVLALFFVLALPFGMSARLLYRLVGSSVLFDWFAQAFSVLPGLPGSYCRVCYYNQVLDRCPLSASFAFGSVVTKIAARIGERVYVGLYSSVGYADIGEDAVLANYVSVLSGARQHNFDDPDRPIFANEDVFQKVTIGANTFLGDKATVMADIGRCTIIGAGAVVVSSIPDYVVAAGSPAKVVKQRRTDAGLDRED